MEVQPSCKLYRDEEVDSGLPVAPMSDEGIGDVTFFYAIPGSGKDSLHRSNESHLLLIVRNGFDESVTPKNHHWPFPFIATKSPDLELGLRAHSTGRMPPSSTPPYVCQITLWLVPGSSKVRPPPSFAAISGGEEENQ